MSQMIVVTAAGTAGTDGTDGTDGIAWAALASLRATCDKSLCRVAASLNGNA